MGELTATFEPVRLRAALSPAAVDRIETPANKKIENLVLVLFWLLLLEGVLRKWVAPQFSQYIFFIRDPFVLLLYWHALRVNAFRGSSMLLQFGLAFAFIAVLLAFFQSISFSNTRMFVVAIYGWRQYFLYLPLPFAMAATLQPDFLPRFMRHAFWAVILTAPIVFLQFNSPGDAVINRGIAEEESLQFKAFGLTEDTIRPAGPFTSTVGIGNLVPSSLALLFAAWLRPAATRRVNMPLLLLATAATATCLAMSGSRGTFVHATLVVLGSLAAALIIRQGGGPQPRAVDPRRIHRCWSRLVSDPVSGRA